jgi:CheY-like chemotaxis protein
VSRRILLVDDDIAEISAVKRVLTRAGHTPVLATNTADAVAAVEQGRPDLVIVGSTCEGGYALTLTHRLEKGEETSAVPVIVLGQADGASDAALQLPRPLDPEQLAEQMKSLLEGLPLAPPAAARPRPPAPAPGGAGRPGPPGASPDRRAAADALRARAEEIRRAGPGPAAQVAPSRPAGSRPPPGRPAGARPGPGRPAPAPAAPVALDLGTEDEGDGLAEVLRRAEALEKAAAAERSARTRQADRAKVEAAQRAEAERLAVEKARRADAEARRAVQAEAKARAEEQARAEAEQKRRAEAEQRAEAARRAHTAEQRARAEMGQRKALEAELQDLRARLEQERSRHQEELQTVRERAAAEEKANEEIRRMAEEEAEEALREAIASARAEMEALRRRGEEEARRREQAEAEVARLTEDANRLAAARAALDEAGAEPSAEEVALRRRIQALKQERPGGGTGGRAAGEFEPPAWLQPSEPPRRPAPGAGPAGEPAPPPPELRSGDLVDLPAPRLLALVGRARLGGRIDFSADEVRSIYFEDGRVVGATSAVPSERVEDLAVRLGLVTRDQYRQVAGATSTLPTRRAALVLLERGFLKPNELTGLVRRRTEEVLFALFAETEGRYRWIGAEVPPDERIALERGTLALVLEGVRRRWLADRVDAFLGGPATLVSPAQDGPPVEELGLAPGELRAIALADGLRTLDEIVAASPLDPLTTRQVLAGLVLVGALSVRVHRAGRPASAAAAAIDLARVREKLDQVRRADYFVILGVGRLCTPHEVRDAADRLFAEFDPRRFAGMKDEALLGKLEEILRVVADAREVLADERLREEYLRGLGGA